MLPNQARSIWSNASLDTKSFWRGRSLGRSLSCVALDLAGWRARSSDWWCVLVNDDRPAAIALFERGSTLTLYGGSVFTSWMRAPASSRSRSARDVLDDPVERLAARDHLVEQPVDLLLVEPDAVDRILVLQRLQQRTQGGEVPSCALCNTIKRDAQRRGLKVVQLEFDDVALGPAHGAHAHEAPVPAYNAAGALLDHQRLGLPEARQTGAYCVQVLLTVLARVGRVSVQRGERYAANCKVDSRGHSRAPGSLDPLRAPTMSFCL